MLLAGTDSDKSKPPLPLPLLFMLALLLPAPSAVDALGSLLLPEPIRVAKGIFLVPRPAEGFLDRLALRTPLLLRDARAISTGFPATGAPPPPSPPPPRRPFLDPDLDLLREPDRVGVRAEAGGPNDSLTKYSTTPSTLTEGSVCDGISNRFRSISREDTASSERSRPSTRARTSTSLPATLCRMASASTAANATIGRLSWSTWMSPTTS